MSHSLSAPRLFPCPLVANLWCTTSPSSPAEPLEFSGCAELGFPPHSRDGQRQLYNILWKDVQALLTNALKHSETLVFPAALPSHFTILHWLPVPNVTMAEREKQNHLILSSYTTVIKWEIGKEVNSKGTIAAVLKYFGLFLYDTVLFSKREVRAMCVRRPLERKKKTIRKDQCLTELFY